MAMGDSITAGFAMDAGVPLEWRGLVFSAGGDKYESEFSTDPAMTIPNYLKHYNPNLVGDATGTTIPLAKGSGLNGAVSMAKVEDLPDQVNYLVTQLRTTYKDQVDFNKDWKLLTIFIGANNLCGSCDWNRTNSFPAFFENQLRSVLQQVKDSIPRVFVSLVTIFNISGVWDAGMTKEYCILLWDVDKHECGCLTTGDKKDRDAMDWHSMAFNQIQEKLAKEFDSQNNDSFTVVVQPGVSGIPIGVFGEKYLSLLDCFHPSVYADAAFTYAIWNNMMEPQGQKSHVPDPNNIVIKCPTADTYIQ